MCLARFSYLVHSNANQIVIFFLFNSAFRSTSGLNKYAILLPVMSFFSLSVCLCLLSMKKKAIALSFPCAHKDIIVGIIRFYRIIISLQINKQCVNIIILFTYGYHCVWVIQSTFASHSYCAHLFFSVSLLLAEIYVFVMHI